MGPIAAIAAGVEIDVTGSRACEAVDQAMDGTACARLRDVEADTVAVAVDALEPQQDFDPDLEAGKGAVEVRPRALRKLLGLVLAKHPAPCTDLGTVAQESLIALALVEGAEAEHDQFARDCRQHRLHGDFSPEQWDHPRRGRE